MININLVPDELKKKKKDQFLLLAFKDIPLEVSVGIAGGFLALLLAVNILLQVITFLGAANYKRLELSWQGMGSEKVQVEKIMKDLDVLRKKIAVIENIKNGMRISWAQKLNSISDTILPGVWLNHLALDKDKLLIEGNSVSKKGDHLSGINRFNNVLKNDQNFMKGIGNIEVSSIERKKMNDAGLASFSITATLDKNYEQIFTP